MRIQNKPPVAASKMPPKANQKEHSRTKMTFQIALLGQTKDYIIQHEAPPPWPTKWVPGNSQAQNEKNSPEVQLTPVNVPPSLAVGI